MDSEIFERLDILHESDQINRQDKEKTVKAVEYLENKLKIKVEKEVGGMFATHLAKALSRMNNGQAIQETTEQADKAAQEHPEILREAKTLFEDILGIKDVPKGEMNFIAMYIFLMLNP